MGSTVAAPKPSDDCFDMIREAPPASMHSSPLSVMSHHVSSSFLYCVVQHAAEWPDYYVIVDLREKAAYDKAHIPGSLWAGTIEESLAEHLQSMIVAVVDHQPNSRSVRNLMKQLERDSVAAASLYILDETFAEFRRKYFFILSNFKPTRGQLPGPIEYIPRSHRTPGVYGIQRNKYPNCKTVVAYLGCTRLINLSSTKLKVNISQVTVENICFDGNNEPYEQAVSALFNFAQAKPCATNNILLIDEPGSHFSALVTGWFLIEFCGRDVEAVCQHMSNKSADLDPWYMNTLQHWAASKRIGREVPSQNGSGFD